LAQRLRLDFNHRANLDLFVQRTPDRRNSSWHSARTALAPRNSSRPEIMGNMIFYVPDSAGTENSAQLRFKNVYVLETKTDSTPAKERI